MPRSRIPPRQPPGPAALLLGGLTAADTSSASIVFVTARGARPRGTLPTARHDTAAVTIGGAVYLFGGGDGTKQLDEILRIDPATGRVTAAGRLPAASSDSGAAAVGGTAYVVGGYTGTRWLDTIVAWKPGGAAHVVAHLPSPVRYAAVTAVGGTVVIAGGSLPAGTASAAVIGFDPATGSVRRLGTLPAPTTHAAAAAIGGLAYVIGGRGATWARATDRIVSVDPAARKVRAAGTLDVARSDLAAIGLGGRILLAGGRAASGTVATISELVPGRAAQAAVGRIPPLLSKTNVYAADGANMLSPAVAGARSLVYVPNSVSDTVDVVDPKTYKIVAHYPVGGLPQHVVPAWDLRTLYVTNDTGNSLTPIDPTTGRPKGPPIPVDDPYNMYFTPDGRYAIVVAERLHRLDFRDAHTFALHRSVTVPCSGVDHMDFTADGRYALASCEFSGLMLKIDIARERVVKTIALHLGAMPQDVKLSPDGKVFYVADMWSGGVWEIDGNANRKLGLHAHGARRARPLPEPRRQVPLRDEPRRGVDLGDQLPHAEAGGEVADPRRRQPRHGRRLGRREGVLGLGPLQQRPLRDLDERRKAAREDPRRQRPARRLRLAPARPLLTRPHRHPPVAAFSVERRKLSSSHY